MAVTRYKRKTRNIVACTKERIEYILSHNGFDEVDVARTWKETYDFSLPVVLVRVSTTRHEKIEIGSDTTYRYPLIIIDVFAQTDTQREDIKDLLILKLKGGWNYQEFLITGGVTTDATIDSRATLGKLTVEEITDTPLNQDVADFAELHEYEKYRHRITLETMLSMLEE